MGGTINVTVREKDGKITRMCRWTNNLTLRIHTVDFLKDPDKVLKQYIEEGKDSNYNQDEVSLSPDGYGLVVFDAVSRTILSNQGYTSFSNETGAKYALDLKLYECLDFKSRDSIIPFINLKKLESYNNKTNSLIKDIPFIETKEMDTLIAEMKVDYDFFMAGGILGNEKILQILREENKNKVFKSKNLKHYERIYKLLNNNKERTIDDWKEFLEIINTNGVFNHFAISTGQFKEIRYDESKKSWDDFKEKLIELDFKFTKKDLQDWDKYVSESYDDL